MLFYNSAHQYLRSVGLQSPDNNVRVASALWEHSLAIGYSPHYLAENGYGVRYNWPRIPLPTSREALLDSARFGTEIASLLDTETEPSGVTAGVIRPELSVIGSISAMSGSNIDPAKDLVVDVGWGHAGKGGEIVMPGKGCLIERDYTTQEREAISKGAEALGLSLAQALMQLGESTFDVFLNERAYWKNIPKGIWEYYIGGYQVVKKWLSYREAKLLGRPITPDEARWVTSMARRIAAICLLQPELDANYLRVKSNTYKWQQ